MRIWMLAAAALVVPAVSNAQPAGKSAYGAWGVDLRDMDASVKPGDDFFRYVEGSWLKNAPIAEDKSRAGYNYDLPDATEVEVRGLVVQAGATSDPMMRQIGDYYAAYSDQAAIDARGLAPLQPYLKRIANLKTKHELV